MSVYNVPARHILLAADIAMHIVLDEFRFFLDPGNIGPNFSWDNFVNMERRRVAVHIGLYFSDSVWKRYKKELKEIAEKTAGDVAECLMLAMEQGRKEGKDD